MMSSFLWKQANHHIAAAAAESRQSCLTLCNPIDGSPPGSSVHGIFQARVLEWGAIAFSDTPVYSLLVTSRGPIMLLQIKDCQNLKDEG